MERRFISPFIISMIIYSLAVYMSFVFISPEGMKQDLIPTIPGNIGSDIIVLFIVSFSFMYLVFFIGPYIAYILFGICYHLSRYQMKI